ncbi:hypothetical protein [Marinobacter sp.]|uniref:hypothetical protein n=1 Tax=Marinobacter sp. TaxID=50741 RepID=UPI00356A8BA9
MLARITLLSVLVAPVFVHAGLLQYDLDFDTYDSEHSVSGTGFLLADTELDAVVGGQLVCDEFVFTWAGSEPAVLTWLDEYYGADVVRGGPVSGVDELTGEAGTFELMFLLWPPADNDSFADKLQTHNPEDVWSTIHLPSATRPEGHWMNAPLTTHFTLNDPVAVVYGDGADVSAPASLPLMALGLLVLVARCLRAMA